MQSARPWQTSTVDVSISVNGCAIERPERKPKYFDQMEDQPKSSLTVMLWWILAGVLFVSVAFIIGAKSGLVTAVRVACITAGVYLIALTLFIARKPLRRRTRISAYLVVGLSLGFIAFSWYQTQHTTAQRTAILLEQSAARTRGAAIGHMTRLFQRTLEEYYQGNARSRGTLSDVFFRQYPAFKDWNSDRPFNIGGSNIRRFLVSEAPDSLVLVIQAAVKGRSPDFRNRDSTMGSVQEKMILTTKGMIHVSEN